MTRRKLGVAIIIVAVVCCIFAIGPILLDAFGISEDWMIQVHWLSAITLAAEMGVCLKSNLKKRYLTVSVTTTFLMEAFCVTGFVFIPLAILKHSLVPTHLVYHGLHGVLTWISIGCGYVLSPRPETKTRL